MISEDRLSLNMERAAHRETRAHLARMTQAAQYWQVRATNGGLDRMALATDGLPIPLPIPTPAPAGGAGGGEVLVVVCELLEATAQLAGRLALQQGGTPPGHSLDWLIPEIQNCVDRLAAELSPAGGR